MKRESVSPANELMAEGRGGPKGQVEGGFGNTREGGEEGQERMKKLLLRGAIRTSQCTLVFK